MTKVVRFEAPGSATIVDIPDQPVATNEVRIATLFSGISAGTELTAYRGTNPYLNARWDDRRRFFVPGSVSFDYPIDGWGYEEVGTITEIGTDVQTVRIGDLVWGTWGHRASVVRPADYVARRVLDGSVSPIRAIFNHIGAIALNATLDAQINIGETVAVFGAGVPGQLVAQLARLSGGRVIVVDRIPARLDLAKQLGADTIDAGTGDVADQIRERTKGRGADVCIEITGAYPALHEAIRSVAYNSRVVVAGFFQGEGRGLRLGEEAHHNRTQLVVSQISGVAPQLQHRWDEFRLQSTAVDLATSGRLEVEPLITHRIPADEAPMAFELLDRDPASALQIVLEY